MAEDRSQKELFERVIGKMLNTPATSGKDKKAKKEQRKEREKSKD